jgi:hypothetical protein
MGAGWSHETVHDHPERVRWLVLVNTFAHNGLTVGERLENRVYTRTKATTSRIAGGLCTSAVFAYASPDGAKILAEGWGGTGG